MNEEKEESKVFDAFIKGESLEDDSFQSWTGNISVRGERFAKKFDDGYRVCRGPIPTAYKADAMERLCRALGQPLIFKIDYTSALRPSARIIICTNTDTGHSFDMIGDGWIGITEILSITNQPAFLESRIQNQ